MKVEGKNEITQVLCFENYSVEKLLQLRFKVWVRVIKNYLEMQRIAKSYSSFKFKWYKNI